MNRLAVMLLLCAGPAFAGEEDALEASDPILINALCRIATIPAPHGVWGHVELGALRAPGKLRPDGKPAEAPTTFGWISIATDEKTLGVPAAQYAKNLQQAMRRAAKDTFPAPCVNAAPMESTVVTAVVRTDAGFVPMAGVESEVRSEAALPDLAQAEVVALNLADALTKKQLKPVWVKNLHRQKVLSGRLAKDWSRAP